MLYTSEIIKDKLSDKKLKFYEFNQNNSGGNFVIDKDAGIFEIVYIEASSSQEADFIAKNIGIYFDGVSKNIDCYCCGDRWALATESESYDSFESVLKAQKYNYHERFVVHYLNGIVRLYEIGRE